MAEPIKDFGRIASRLFRFLRYASYTLIGFMLYMFVVHVAQAFQFFAAIHESLAWLFLAAVLALFAWLIGRPIYRFLQVPVAIRPPELPPKGERTSEHLAAHARFLECYLENLRTNPEWDGEATELDQAVSACQMLRADAGRTDADADALGERMAAFEKDVVAKILAPLDRKAADVIRREALGVGVATAVSWNGAVDAFIVLWRNLNLAARIARIYYGRPGVRGTFAVLRDVSAATLLSAYLQDLTEAAGSAAGSILGKSVGVVAAPLLDGALNAVVTLRIGYVTKARCRAMEGWNERTRVQAVAAAFTEAGRFSKGVVMDVVNTVGRGVMHLPGKVLGSIGDAFASVWRKFGGEPEPDPEPSGA